MGTETGGGVQAAAFAAAGAEAAVDDLLMHRIEPWMKHTSNILSHEHKKLREKVDLTSKEHRELRDEIMEWCRELPALVAQMVDPSKTSAEFSESPTLRGSVAAHHLQHQVMVLKRELAEAKEKSSGQNTAVDVLVKIQNIEDRGNLVVDYRTGDVEVAREIPFEAKRQSEEPLAEFKDATVAREILFDIVELWEVFRVVMTIEGHTKGGETGFWQALADNRAELIVSTLEEMGVCPEMMVAKGLPGKKGLNKVGVMVRFDIFPER